MRRKTEDFTPGRICEAKGKGGKESAKRKPVSVNRKRRNLGSVWCRSSRSGGLEVVWREERQDKQWDEGWRHGGGRVRFRWALGLKARNVRTEQCVKGEVGNGMRGLLWGAQYR